MVSRRYLRWIMAGLCLFLGGVDQVSAFIGGYAAPFTRMAADARNMALGGALVAEINPGFRALTNPATLATVTRREIGFSHLVLPLDRSIQGLAVVSELPGPAAVGIAYIRAGDDNIQGRNSIGQRTELYKYTENMVTLSFANKFSDAVTIGINTRILFMDLATESTRGFSTDLGLLWTLPEEVNLGIRLQNVFGGYSWKVEADEGERIYDERFPRILSLGFRRPMRHLTLLLQSDVLFQTKSDVSVRLRFGAEDIINDRYFLRVGMNSAAVTLGTGMIFSAFGSRDSRIDYGLSIGSQNQGLGHLFTWIFSL